MVGLLPGHVLTSNPRVGADSGSPYARAIGLGRETSHLVVSIKGYHGPCLCRLTRFDQRDENYTVTRKADLPGWSMNGGTSGPDVRQVACEACWVAAARLAAVPL